MNIAACASRLAEAAKKAATQNAPEVFGGQPPLAATFSAAPSFPPQPPGWVQAKGDEKGHDLVTTGNFEEVLNRSQAFTGLSGEVANARRDIGHVSKHLGAFRLEMLGLNREFLSSVKGEKRGAEDGKEDDEQTIPEEPDDPLQALDDPEEAFVPISPKGPAVIVKAKVNKNMHEQLCTTLAISTTGAKSKPLEALMRERARKVKRVPLALGGRKQKARMTRVSGSSRPSLSTCPSVFSPTTTTNSDIACSDGSFVVETFLISRTQASSSRLPTSSNGHGQVYYTTGYGL